MSYLVTPFLIALSSLFFLVDPFAAIPPFLVMTQGSTAVERRRTAKRACFTCFLVLGTFAVAGSMIFKLFGITLPALRIAGGCILFLIGIDMLQARQSKTKQAPGEAEEALEREDVGIIPLGVPILAGPGAISTVMVLIGDSLAWQRAVPVFIAIAATAFGSYFVLAGADRLRRFLGETGIHILMRLMGLLLTAIAVQFVINGLYDLGVLHSR